MASSSTLPVPEVTLSAPPVVVTAEEEGVAVITFGTVPSMVTRLSVEAKYAYLALCASALDKCRFDLRAVDGGGGGGGGGGEDYATLLFHRVVMRDLVS